MNNMLQAIWNKVKTPFKTLALVVAVGLLPSACKNKSNQEGDPIKDLAYYHANHLPLKLGDMYGDPVISHTVEIRIYKDATMVDEWNGSMRQVRWGIYKDELGKSFENEKTHAELVYLDEVSNNQGWVEVFDNEYGISICKDQPCFLVDREGHLRLIGNKDTYDRNLKRYKAELDRIEEIARKEAERGRQQYQKKKREWDSKQIAVMESRGFVEKEDSLPQDKLVQNSDTLLNNHTIPDSIHSLSDKTIRTDTIIADTINQRG